MSTQPSESLGYSPYRLSDEGRGRYDVAGRDHGFAGLPVNWMIAGLVVLGLGVLAWRHFGPDVIRYMKIRDM